MIFNSVLSVAESWLVSKKNLGAPEIPIYFLIFFLFKHSTANVHTSLYIV